MNLPGWQSLLWEWNLVHHRPCAWIYILVLISKVYEVEATCGLETKAIYVIVILIANIIEN